MLTIDDWWPVTYTEEEFGMESQRGKDIDTAEGTYTAMREAEVGSLRDEVVRLKQENYKLRLEAAYWKSLVGPRG